MLLVLALVLRATIVMGVRGLPKQREGNEAEEVPIRSAAKEIEYMRQALKEAEIAGSVGEVPIGAVLVDDLTGKVIATGRNMVETQSDATAHAEMVCLRAASGRRKNWRLISTTMFVTIEPCPMCFFALAQSRVGSIVYGEKNTRLGACECDFVHPFHTFRRINGGVLRYEASFLMKSFFRNRRQSLGPASASSSILKKLGVSQSSASMRNLARPFTKIMRKLRVNSSPSNLFRRSRHGGRG
eukprot:jgi/Bigna1/46841/estExt_Genewise1.C_70205